MTPEDYSHLTPEQDDQIESLADKRGISMAMAREILGFTVEVNPLRLPGKPVSHNKPSGHVRGFSDGELRDGEVHKSTGFLTSEERETLARGVANARQKLADSKE